MYDLSFRVDANLIDDEPLFVTVRRNSEGEKHEPTNTVLNDNARNTGDSGMSAS